MHRNLKIRQDYKASDMPTVVENIRKEKDVQAAFVEDAIIGVGPYQLATPYKHFQVDVHVWTYKWSQRQRDQHLKKFHESSVPKKEHTDCEQLQDISVIDSLTKDVIVIDDESSPSASQQEASQSESAVPFSEAGLSTDERCDQNDLLTTYELSVPFSETGLSPVYRGAYDKAARLSKTNNVVKAPGKHVGYITESESGSAPNFVEIKKDGSCVCQCHAYKVSSVCSHALAVAHIAGCLDEYLVWYHTKSGGANLTATASVTAPKNSGMKPGQTRRQRSSRKTSSERHREEYSERRPYTQCSGDGQVYTLKWLSTSTARVCYGCGGQLRESISNVPVAPHDVVLTTKEYRSWFDRNTNKMKITTKPESTHYHINPACVRKKNPSFEATKHLHVSAEDREVLLPSHKQLLKQSLNILIQ